jgi:hypothetical protein
MAIQFHMIWREQIGAVAAIRSHHGEEAAFDYIVDEKLMNYAEAAEDRPKFARELPRFVAAIRDAFSSDTMRYGLQRLARYLEGEEVYTAEALLERQGTPPCDTPADDTENDEDDDDFEDDDFEDNETLARRLQELAMRRRRFEFLRELLIAERLGTA